jgi:kinetochore protein Spc25, fungi type
MYAQISELESHQANQLAQREKLKNAIAQTQRQIEQKLEKQREYAAKIESQARLNGPELNFWETYLGCRIEGSGDESKVKVVFVFPSGKGGEEREAMFELQVPESGAGGYEVVATKPRLKAEDVQRVVGRLNETREIATVLKGMRALFVQEMK